MGKAETKSGWSNGPSLAKATSPRKASAKRTGAADGNAAPSGADDKEADDKSEFVEVIAEDGDHVEPTPPEIVEPDPELSAEEAEQARKDYLLTRF